MADTQRSSRRANGITIRAVFIGLLLSFFLNVVSPYVVLVMHTAGLAADFINAGAVLFFFILLGTLNPILKLLRKDWGLTAPELVIIYIMTIAASAIPTWGLVANLLPIMVGGYYFATPENRWEELIHPYIKHWLVPQDPHAIKYFFEGLPSGMSVPWKAWITPLAAWAPLLLAVYFVMVCMMAILRKQWIENERLIFPLTQLPLEMMKDDREDGIVKSFYKSGLMWWGFLIPFVLLSFNGLNHYFHYVPRIQFDYPFYIFRNTTWMTAFINFPVIGFTYFLNLDLAFSLWFFHILSRIQTGAFNITGFDIPGHVEVFTGSSLSVSHQGMGAMIVLLFFGLWTARKHLKAVFKKAIFNSKDIDDSNEVMSYRMAVLGTLVGLIFIGFWLWMSGMAWWVVPIFLFAAFGIFLVLARIIAEGGVGFCRAQMIPQPFIVYGFGTQHFGVSTLLSLGFTYSWAADIRTTVMASSINGFKLAEAVGMVKKRSLFWIIALAVVVSLIGSIWMTLKLAYSNGGINLQGWFFGGMPRTVFEFIADKINNPISLKATQPRWLFTGIGGGIMAGLMLLRRRFLWWPLHYIGFPIGDTWVMSWIWFSVMLGWFLKLLILHFGGVRLYRPLRPFFLGLILGQISCAGMWMIIDFLAKETDNYIHIGVP